MAQTTDPVTRPATDRPIGVTRTSDNPDAIANDIRETRAEMDETLDALGSKLDPSRLVDDAKDALTAKAHDLVDRAGDAMSGKGGGSLGDTFDSNQLIETVKQNPLPAAAVGLSVAWFLSKFGESKTDQYRRDRYGAAGARPMDYRYGQSSGRSGTDSDDSLTDKASDAVGDAKDKAASVADRVGDAASDAASSARDFTQSSGESLKHAGQQAESWLDRQLHTNPLAVGAVALAAGALVGLSVPESEAEHRLMGDQADDLKRQAATTIRDTADDVSDTVQDAADKAKERAEDVAAEAESKAEDVADTAEQKAAEATSGSPSSNELSRSGGSSTLTPPTGTVLTQADLTEADAVGRPQGIVGPSGEAVDSEDRS